MLHSFSHIKHRMDNHTFEIAEGSSRKSNFEESALPLRTFQGIKILNIIRWINICFDPVLIEHHGLEEMNLISVNHESYGID